MKHTDETDRLRQALTQILVLANRQRNSGIATLASVALEGGGRTGTQEIPDHRG